MPSSRIHAGPLPLLEPLFLDELAARKRAASLAPLVVLAPSNLLAVHLRRSLALRHGGAANLSWLTFRDLADRLAGDGGPRIPRGGEQLLGRDARDRLPRGGSFDAIRDRPGLAEVLAGAARDLRDGGIDLDDAVAAAAAEPDFARHVAPLEAIRETWGPIGAEFEDTAARFGRAAERGGDFPALFGTAALLAYGFYDLTETQERLLLALSSRLALDLYLPVARREEESFESRLVRRLERRGFAVEWLGTEAGGSDLVRLRRALAGLGPDGGGAADDGSLRIVSSAGRIAEAREVAREIATLLDAGKKPSSIAVPLLDPEGSASLVEEALERAGIPFRRSDGRPLAAEPEGLAALALVSLARDREEPTAPRPGGPIGAPRLPRGELLRFFSVVPPGPAFGFRSAADGERIVPRWESLSADAGIAAGIDSWESRLETWEARRRPDLLAEVDGLRRVVRRLAGDLAAPAAGESATNLGRIERWIEDWIADSPTRERILETIGGLAPLGEFAAAAALEPPSWDELLRLVEEAILGATLRDETRFGRGGVELMPLASLRGLRFDVVVFPGLDFGAFPRGTGPDPLLPDRLRRAIELRAERAGRPGRLAVRGERAREEELLFRLALEAARERVVLTWSRVDGSGRRQFPSRLLSEAAQLLGGEELSASPVAVEAQLRGPSPGGLAVDRLELLRPLAGTGVDALRGWLRGRKPTAARLLDRWAESSGHGRWTRWDGLVPPEGELAGILEGAAPAAGGGRSGGISPSDIETWCTCPRRHLFARILGLRKAADPVEEPAMNPADRGTMVHAILERFVKSAIDEERTGVAGVAEGSPEWRRLVDRIWSIAEERFAACEREGAVGYPLLWEQVKRETRQDLEGWLRRESHGDSAWRWTEVELWFGSSEGAPFELELDGHRFLFRGKIDRIDLHADGRQLRVVDYKSGKDDDSRPDDIDGGTRFQMPVYMAAAASHFGKELADTHGLYDFVSARRGWRTVAWSGSIFVERGEWLSQVAGTVQRGVSGGLFFPNPGRNGKNCDYCDFRSVCLPTVAEAERNRCAGDPGTSEFDALAKLTTRKTRGGAKESEAAPAAEADRAPQGTKPRKKGSRP